MAYITNPTIPAGSLTAIDTVAKYAVLTKVQDSEGNEYMYLKGVANTIVGAVVTFDEAGVTTLLAADAVGPCAVAIALTVASTYGWYLVKGSKVVKTAGDVGDNGNVYATATAGAVDDAVVAGDRIHGMWFRAAGTGATTVLAQVHYPVITNIAD